MTSTLKPSIVAVTDKDPSAGALVWWKLADHTSAVALRQQWAAAGLPDDMFPPTATATKALSRAVRDQTDKHRIKRRVGRASLALVDEAGADRDDLDPNYGVKARAKLDADGTLSVATRDGDTALATRIRTAFESHLGELSSRDLSHWLAGRVMESVQAVSCRDAGGVYFIPASQMATYRRVASALMQAGGHSLYEVPALPTDQAVTAILDALTSEIDGEVNRMQTELDEGDLGGRALQTRRERCDGLAVKLGAYTALLGGKVDGLRDQVTALQGQVAAAALAALIDNAEEEKAS